MAIGSAGIAFECEQAPSLTREFRAELWRSAVGDHLGGDGTTTRRIPVLENIGAHRVHLWVRQTTHPADVRRDRLRGRCIAVADQASPQREALLVQTWRALNRECPPFEHPTELWRWYEKQIQPYSFRAVPGGGSKYYREVLRVYSGLHSFNARDIVFVPFIYDSALKLSKGMLFYTDHVVEDFTPFQQAALFLLGTLEPPRPLRLERDDGAPVFSEKAMEIFRWAVQGKTVDEISEITGFGAKSIRYQLYRARHLFGYATVTQTLVKIAKTYGLSP